MFTPPNSIISFVDYAKYSVDLRQQKGVYEFPFSCREVYIGEIGRLLQVHLKEHIVDITHNHVTELALVEHSHFTSHQVCMENATIITREENYNKRQMR